MPIQQETPLLRSFKTLHDHLQAVDDLSDVDALTYLRPFLDVMRSADASGPITGIALQAINKFILYGLIQEETIGGHGAVNAVASAASRCKFESSSSSDDETTLMQLLELVENVVRCSAGRMLTGTSVWQACETCYRISDMPRASHLLRATADSALSHVILTLFTRLPTMALRQSVPLQPVAQAAPLSVAAERGAPGAEAAVSSAASREQAAGGAKGVAGSALPPPPSLQIGSTRSTAIPHSAADLAKILSWLAGLLDPTKHAAPKRLKGLRLVSMVLECSGQSMGRFPALVKVCQAELCRMLVQNSRSEEVGVLSATLRVVFNLFVSLKAHLKVPLEVFFTSVHLMLANSRTASAEQRELAIESLLEFAREPGMMLDMYVNYDCDVACTNLFEALCVCLGRNAVPRPSARLTNLHVLSVEGILSIAEGLARRCSPDVAVGATAASRGGRRAPSMGTGGAAGMMRASGLGRVEAEEAEAAAAAAAAAVDVATSAATRVGGSTADQKAVLAQLSARLEDLRRNKQVKRRMGQLALRFNEVEGKHRDWVPFATDLGLLPKEPTPEDVAELLLKCHGMDKKWVGEYLAKPDDAKYAFQAKVRTAFTKQFDFASLRIDEALRHYLSTFRLPGEAQTIDRMMEAFATRFFEQSRDPLRKQDTAFILAFSIVMLNTDAHNQSIPEEKKMTLKGFLRNNSGIDDGQDLPQEYLTQIYESIRSREIAMPQGPTAVAGRDADSKKKGAADGSAADEENKSDDGSGPSADASSQAAPAIGKHWDGVLRRQGVASAYTDTAAATANGGSLLLPAGEHERDMFQILVKPAIAAIQAVASATQDEATLVKCTQGLRHLAACAAYFVCTQALDDIVASTIYVARTAMLQILVVPANACILPAGPVALPLSAGRVSPDPFGAGAAAFKMSDGQSPDVLDAAGGTETAADSGLGSPELSGVPPVIDAQAVAPGEPSAAMPSPDRKHAGPVTGPGEQQSGDSKESQDEAHRKLRAEARALLSMPDTPHVHSGVDSETGLPICPPGRTPAMYLLRRALLLLRAALSLTATHCGGLRQSWKAVVALVLHMQRQDCLPGALVDEDDFTTPGGDPLPSARFTDTRYAAVRGADDDSDGDSRAEDSEDLDGSSVGRSSFGGDVSSVGEGGGIDDADTSELVTSARSVLSRRRRRDGQRAQPRRPGHSRPRRTSRDGSVSVGGSVGTHTGEISTAHRPPRHQGPPHGANGAASSSAQATSKEGGGWLFTGIRSLFGLQQDTDDEEAEKHTVVAGSLAAEASRQGHGLQEIFGGTVSKLPRDALLSLMAALSEGYPQTVAAADDAAQAVLCLELGVAVALRNVWRGSLVAPFVFDAVRRGLFLHPCSFVPGEEPSITMEERMLPSGEPAAQRASSGSGAPSGQPSGDDLTEPQVEWALRTNRPAWLQQRLRSVRDMIGPVGFVATDGLVWPGTAAPLGTQGGIGSGADGSGGTAQRKEDDDEDLVGQQMRVWLDEEARMERAHLVERAAVAAMRFSTRATEACDRHSAQNAARRAGMCLPAAGTSSTMAGHEPSGPAMSPKMNPALFAAMQPVPSAAFEGVASMGANSDAAASASGAASEMPGADCSYGDATASVDAQKPDIDHHVVPFLCLLQVLAKPVADILAPRIAAGSGLLGSVAAGSTDSLVFWRLVFDTLKGCTRNFYAAPLVWEALRRSVSPELARPSVCADIIRTILPLACPPLSGWAGYRSHQAALADEERLPDASQYDTQLDFLLDEEAVGDLHDVPGVPMVSPVEDEAAVGLTAALVLEQRQHALLQARLAASRALGGVGANNSFASSGSGNDGSCDVNLFGGMDERDLPAATIAARRAAQAACKVVFGQELEAARAHASAAVALARQRLQAQPEGEEGGPEDEEDSRRRLELHARVAAASSLGLRMQSGEDSTDVYYHTVAGAVVGLPLVELRRVASLAVIGQLERLPAVSEQAISSSAAGCVDPGHESWRVWQLSLRGLVALLRECAIGGAATAMKYMRVSSDGKRGVVTYAPVDSDGDGSTGIGDEEASEDEGNQKLRASVAHECLHAIGTLLLTPPKTALDASEVANRQEPGRHSEAADADDDPNRSDMSSQLEEGTDLVRLPLEILLWTMQAVVLPLAGARDAPLSSRFAGSPALKELSPSIPGSLGMLPGGAEVASESTSLATRVLANAAPHLRDAAPEWFFGYWIEFVRAMSEDIARWGPRDADVGGGSRKGVAASAGSAGDDSDAAGRERRGDSLPAPPSQRGSTADVLGKLGIEESEGGGDVSAAEASRARGRSDGSRARAGSRHSDISSVSSLEGTDGFVAAAQNLQNLLLVARASRWLRMETEETEKEERHHNEQGETAASGGAASGHSQDDEAGEGSMEQEAWQATWDIVRESCPSDAAESLYEAVKVFDNPPPPSPRQAAQKIERQDGGMPMLANATGDVQVGDDGHRLAANSADPGGAEDELADSEEEENEDGDELAEEGNVGDQDGCIVS